MRETKVKASGLKRRRNLRPMVWPFVAALFAFAGCAAFQAPSHKADGPTVATGEYDSKAEKWQDEALADQRKSEKAKTEGELRKLDRK